MNIHKLNHELHQYEELRRRILDADPDIDTLTLMDTLEGITDLHDIISATARSILADQDMVAALKTRLKDMRERLERFEQRMSVKRDLVLEAMEKACIDKITQPDFTMSLRKGSCHLIVTDEALIPEWFWVPQPSKLDRQEVLATLKTGEHIPGATLSNTSIQVQIRTK
jgi:Siphovirus Gp157